MSVVITSFERWLETVNALREKHGLEPVHLEEIPVYRDAWKDGLNPEEAILEDACL